MINLETITERSENIDTVKELDTSSTVILARVSFLKSNIFIAK